MALARVLLVLRQISNSPHTMPYYPAPASPPASDLRAHATSSPTTRWLRPAAAVLLCALAAASPTHSRAATAPGQTGAQLLQAQLPTGTGVAQADCEQLTRAVSLATHTHRTEAKLILTAALTRDAKKDPRRPEAKLPCTCVGRLLRASISAAPEKASTLLELASSLYPDCADALEAAVQVMDDKNVVDDKNGPAAAHRPDGTRNATNYAANDPANGVDGSKPFSNSPDSFDPSVEATGFGVGFGPGFPGSPGFTGSSPSGAIALPPEVNPVTNVQNG